MSRKARSDRSTWKTPSVYAFVGDYGPFKPRGHAPVDRALVLLMKDPYLLKSGELQQLLVRDMDESNKKDHQPISYFFETLLAVDLSEMMEQQEQDPDEGQEADSHLDVLAEEAAQTELTKGFGRSILRLLQRLQLTDWSLAAQGDLCPLAWKLSKALEPECRTVWLLHPHLPAQFVNAHLLTAHGKDARGGGSGQKQKKIGAKKKCKHGDKNNTTQPQDKLHLLFESSLARDKRLEILRHVRPHGETRVLAAPSDAPEITPLMLLRACLLLPNNNDNGDTEGATIATDVSPKFDPDLFNKAGKSLFMSKLRVEMSPHTKQYERHSEPIEADSWRNIPPASRKPTTTEEFDTASIDWSTCPIEIGAVVLRGNKCILVRSPGEKKEWLGMRLPSMAPMVPTESPWETAIRCVTHYCEVDADEVQPLVHVPPVALYAPHQRRVVVHFYPLYATQPPLNDPNDDADDSQEEDEDDPYDWYTLSRAIVRLNCERSKAALLTLSSALREAATVGAIPCKWGGVFGQEVLLQDGVGAHAGQQLTTRADESEDTTEDSGMLSSFTYRSRKPFHPRRLYDLLESIVKMNGDNGSEMGVIADASGFVWLATHHDVQGNLSLTVTAGGSSSSGHYSLVPGNPWWAAVDRSHWPEQLEQDIAPLWDDVWGDRQQEIVIRGHGLREDVIATAFQTCRLSEEEFALGQEAWLSLCKGDDGDNKKDAATLFHEDWNEAIIDTDSGSEQQECHHHEECPGADRCRHRHLCVPAS